jgi:hypothetical protein
MQVATQMSKQLFIIKKSKQSFILSDGSSYYDYVTSLKNKSKYTLVSQDFNNHFFWVKHIKHTDLSENVRLLKFRTKYTRN